MIPILDIHVFGIQLKYHSSPTTKFGVLNDHLQTKM